PECLEKRKLLALGFAGVDRQPPGRKTVPLSLGDRAEIAGAKKDADFVVVVGLVDGGMDTKTGKPQIGVGLRRRRVAKGKLLRLVRDLGRLALGHLKDIHPVRINEAAMEELDLERQLFAAPECAIGQKPDGSI